MKPLPIALVFIGYVFIYAAVAASGKFATEPWAGLYEDAYTEKQSSSDNSSCCNVPITRVVTGRDTVHVTPIRPRGTTGRRTTHGFPAK